jgi:protoporphyrinogen/coproporphyrinogen III oxidase
MPRIAIIGGGISGVATAYELSGPGHRDFILYEASPRLGGIVETVRRDGFVIECGPDSWVTEKPWARELAIELGLEAEIIPSNDARRRTYLLEDDQLVPMPDGMRMMVPTDLEAIVASPLFSEQARQAYREEPLRAAELKAFAAGRREDEDESVASFVERHFGAEVAEKIAGPLLAGVFGGDIRQLSAASVMAPFVAMEREHGSLILALQQRQRAAQTQSVFTSLKGGVQTLIEGMVARIAPAAIRLNEAVLSVTPKAGKWDAVTSCGPATFDRVVLATPVHVTRELVAPWNSELGTLLDVEASSAVVAAFAFDRESAKGVKIPEGFGFLVPQRDKPTVEDSDPKLLACTFVDQKFTCRTPEGCVLLRAFFGGKSAPALLDRSDEAILDTARRQLGRVFGELPASQIALVRRWPRSLPQYAVGHRARVKNIEAMAEEVPGLHLLGNAFHGVGLPDLIHHGRTLAGRLFHL